MKIQQITNAQNFEGKLIVVNKLSQKPQRCIDKVCDCIQELINKKDYNLYVRQDYIQNAIGISAEYQFPIRPHQRISYGKIEKYIPIQSKAAMYKKTADDVVKVFEENKRQTEQKNWEQKKQKQKKQEYREIAETVIFAPLYIIGLILESLSPKWAKKYEELLEKQRL